jgi:hypothetical protein
MQDIYAKALALQDRKGERLVLVTTDLLGLTATVSENVAERARRKYGLGRERMMFNSSHTHCGPVIERMLFSDTRDRSSWCGQSASLFRRSPRSPGHGSESGAPSGPDKGSLACPG